MQFSCNPCTFFLMSLDQPAPHTGKSVFGQLSISDVQARSDESGKTAAGIEPRYARVEDPTVLSIMTSGAILHLIRLLIIDCLRVGFHAALEVFFMYYFRPPVSQLCL